MTHQFIANNVIDRFIDEIYTRVSDLIDKVTRHNQA